MIVKCGPKMIVVFAELCAQQSTLNGLLIIYYLREAVIKKKSKYKLFPKREGGVDPKVYIFEILNFGKFQVSKWACGMKRWFKVSFKN